MEKNERGITLLTLAITILIIIILAGVTINATLGDNGLLKQAQDAKDMAESTTIDTEEKMNKIMQEYANVMAEDETIENPGSGTEPEEPVDPPKQGIEASEISENATTYYGAEVTGYTCNSDGVSKWRIFYADENNIYLIADDYIAPTDTPSTSAGKRLNTGYKSYAVYFTNILNDYTGNSWIKSNSKAAKWLSAYSNSSSTNNNIKAVAYLMDTNIWDLYVGEKAEYSIGGPTIELFCASYKDTHPDKYVDYHIANSYGYDIKWSTSSSYDTYITGLTQNDFYGIYIKSDSSKASGMWIASPASSNNNLQSAYSVGNIDDYTYSYDMLGLRPIVCLKSDVRLEKINDEMYEIID